MVRDESGTTQISSGGWRVLSQYFSSSRYVPSALPRMSSRGVASTPFTLSSRESRTVAANSGALTRSNCSRTPAMPESPSSVTTAASGRASLSVNTCHSVGSPCAMPTLLFTIIDHAAARGSALRTQRDVEFAPRAAAQCLSPSVGRCLEDDVRQRRRGLRPAVRPADEHGSHKNGQPDENPPPWVGWRRWPANIRGLLYWLRIADRRRRGGDRYGQRRNVVRGIQFLLAGR